MIHIHQSDDIRCRLFNYQDVCKEPEMYFVHYLSALLSGATYGATICHYWSDEAIK